MDPGLQWTGIKTVEDDEWKEEEQKAEEETNLRTDQNGGYKKPPVTRSQQTSETKQL